MMCLIKIPTTDSLYLPVHLPFVTVHPASKLFIMAINPVAIFILNLFNVYSYRFKELDTRFAAQKTEKSLHSHCLQTVSFAL